MERNIVSLIEADHVLCDALLALSDDADPAGEQDCPGAAMQRSRLPP